MANSMIDCNKTVFSKLRPHVAQVSGLLLGSSAIRYIKTSVVEKRWLQFSDMLMFENCYPGKTAILIEYNRRFYIGLSEHPNFKKVFSKLVISNIDEDGRELNDNSGLHTFVYSCDNVNINLIDDIGNELANNIFGREMEYELKDIKPYFPQYDFWEIESNIKISPTITYCIYGCYIIEQKLQSSGKFILGFEDDTLLKYKNSFESYCGFFIGKNLLNSLQSTKWEHAYLELYRTLENLYQLPFY
jgi:hypothetical protein